MRYQWDFAAVWGHLDMLLVGLVGTVKIALIGPVLPSVTVTSLTVMDGAAAGTHSVSLIK